MKKQKQKLFEHVEGNRFTLNENYSDPDKSEMMHFLQGMYGNEDGFQDSAEVAIYWFANDYHGGQSSNLYSALSTSPFSPGPISNGPEPDSMEEMMYQDLEQEYIHSDNRTDDDLPDYPN